MTATTEVVQTTEEYMGHTIQPKRDFGTHGFLIDGKWVREGFVVTKDGMNVMPGATWFRTIDAAEKGVACLIASRGDSDVFWALMRLAR